jgi:hypothetical protein
MRHVRLPSSCAAVGTDPLTAPWPQVTPVVHALCAPVHDGNGGPVSNIGHFVGIYDDAPGALRVLCDALLREWLQGDSSCHGAAGAAVAAASEVQLIFHHLLELLLDADRNTCAPPRPDLAPCPSTVVSTGVRPVL